jgi:transposase
VRCWKWARSRATERRLVDRARIVLLAGERRPETEIAERVGCSGETVKRQRARYQREGLDGLRDRPKSGRPLTHDHATRAKLIALACTRPPETDEGLRRERWTHRELSVCWPSIVIGSCVMRTSRSVMRRGWGGRRFRRLCWRR